MALRRMRVRSAVVAVVAMQTRRCSVAGRLDIGKRHCITTARGIISRGWGGLSAGIRSSIKEGSICRSTLAACPPLRPTLRDCFGMHSKKNFPDHPMRCGDDKTGGFSRCAAGAFSDHSWKCAWPRASVSTSTSHLDPHCNRETGRLDNGQRFGQMQCGLWKLFRRMFYLDHMVLHCKPL